MLTKNSTDQVSPSVRIEKLVPGGSGLGHLDDGVVFVPLTAPGDLISLKDIRRRRGVHFAECDQVVETSLERRDPPCPWFGRCGGCQWMHLNYGSQIRWKEDIFRQALKGIAHLEDKSPIKVHLSPTEFQYRYRARLHIKGPAVGFYRRSSNRIEVWEQCIQLPEAINLAVKELRRNFRDNRPPATLRSCEVALSPVDGSMTFNWSFKKDRGNLDAARRVMDGWETVASLSGMNPAGQAAFNDSGEAIAARGGNLLLEAGDVRMPASPGTFFQINPDINAVLVGRVLTQLGSLGASSLLDLYCGNGNFSLPAAAAGINSVGVESSPGAVRDAASVAGPRSRFIEMDVGRYLSRDNTEPDAVIVDPPRTGLPGDVVEMLGMRRFPVLIYVSCEPSTLARDLVRLTGAGYVIKGMELFDMFPQTPHSEAMVILKGS